MCSKFEKLKTIGDGATKKQIPVIALGQLFHRTQQCSEWFFVFADNPHLMLAVRTWKCSSKPFGVFGSKCSVRCIRFEVFGTHESANSQEYVVVVVVVTKLITDYKHLQQQRQPTTNSLIRATDWGATSGQCLWPPINCRRCRRVWRCADTHTHVNDT